MGFNRYGLFLKLVNFAGTPQHSAVSNRMEDHGDQARRGHMHDPCWSGDQVEDFATLHRNGMHRNGMHRNCMHRN